MLQTTDLSDGSGEALQRFTALGVGARNRNSLLYVFDAPMLRLAFRPKTPQDGQILAGEQAKASQALSMALGSTLATALWVDLFGPAELARVRSFVEAGTVIARGASPILMGVLIDAGIPLSFQVLACGAYPMFASISQDGPYRGVTKMPITIRVKMIDSQR
ncbi:hypothetical protein [Martelella soudanensis]|uniref:hypothetical protein n=1 Tax=unclassified Martelella TaxID=2629616 RepID=UPI001FF02347|nr:MULTISPECIES: hypothetical protein [unclassified Martelella]